MEPEEQRQELTEVLKKDRTSPYPKYPQQAVYALDDERVAKALDSRFKDNQALVEIGSLSYSFSTGLIPVFFRFAPSAGGAVSQNAVLVIMDHSCAVVGVVDPFDPEQPSPLMPPLQPSGELPFALSKPSAAAQLILREGEWNLKQERAREFLLRIGGDGGGGPGEPGKLCAAGATETMSPGYCIRTRVFCDPPGDPSGYCVLDGPQLVVDEVPDD
jgi:hypothetical protein